MLRAPRLPLPTRTWAASAPPSPSWISMGQCRVTAGVLTALELSGATWTAPTPARVKTSSSVPGSPTTPGHTRHAQLLFQWWWLQLLPLLPSLPSYPSVPAHVPAHSHQVPAHAHVPVQSGAFTSGFGPNTGTLQPYGQFIPKKSSSGSDAVKF